MNNFTLSALHDRPYEVEKAIQDSAVTIVDDKGNPFGVLLHPDEYWALYEVAEIARDPEQYAKATQPASNDEKTMGYGEVFSD
jgi:hypothetical protein